MQCGTELVGDLAPLNSGRFGVVLGEGGSDKGREDAPAALAGMGQDVAYEVHAAPLPGASPLRTCKEWRKDNLRLVGMENLCNFITEIKIPPGRWMR